MTECLEKHQHQYRLPPQQIRQQQQLHQSRSQAQISSLEDVDCMQRQSNHYYQRRQAPPGFLCPDSAALIDTQTLQEQKIQQQNGNELIGYYFGSISRETAEWLLNNHGNHQDGAYLLRSSGPNDDFVLSLLVVRDASTTQYLGSKSCSVRQNSVGRLIEEVLHYKIVETEDSFVALHGQVGDEKFATIDELIEKAQGVATKPRWPIQRQLLESQILPPTYWGLTTDQVRLAILIKAKQWGFPLFSSLFQQTSSANGPTPSVDHSAAIQELDSTTTGLIGKVNVGNNVATTLNNETIRTLIYKSLHEFQPWFHGKISREEAERRMDEGSQKDGRFLVRERDNFSYAMCISHKKTTKHYRIDVLPTGELAIQDGHKFTSLMALVSHYTIMSDGLWCALTEACPRPIQKGRANGLLSPQDLIVANTANNLYNVPPFAMDHAARNHQLGNNRLHQPVARSSNATSESQSSYGKSLNSKQHNSMICPNQSAVAISIKAPIKEWLQTINQKWSQFMVAKNQQSLNSFLFGSSNPLNNHCRHTNRRSHHHHHHHHPKNEHRERRHKNNNGHQSCSSCNHRLNYPNRDSAAKTANVCANNVQLCQPKVLTDQAYLVCEGCAVSPSAKVADPQKFNYLKRCCANDSIMLKQQQTMIQQPVAGVGNDPCRALLSYLPHNSGFTLDSQSFIGSPLFAVKNFPETGQSLVVQQTTGDDNGGNNAREEKLISPAQSISADLNNNQFPMDIYGSQTSTAVVGNRLPTNSSSSSSGNQLQTQPITYNQFNRTSLPMQCSQSHCVTGEGQIQIPVTGIINPGAGVLNQHKTVQRYPLPIQDGRIGIKRCQRNIKPAVQHAGPIMCGQHAGPAYRYTNCHPDDSTMKLCAHLRQIDRSADDTHLQTPSTQLASSVALSKFVQFQDGQCLRTHRDTKSIQMAYLLSRQHQAQQLKSSMLVNNQQNNLVVNNTQNMTHFSQTCPEPLGQVRDDKSRDASQDFDLMDCENDTFKFTYDPKLIKSSSIETLCGGAEEEDEDCLENLNNFKSNSELVMSLQSYWQGNGNLVDSILSPMPVKIKEQDREVINNENYDAPTDPDCSYLNSCGLYNGDSYTMKKKHDLDELTTSLLAELTTSLKAQVDLNNKRSGLATSNDLSTAQSDKDQRDQPPTRALEPNVTSPNDLVNEFDTLKR